MGDLGLAQFGDDRARNNPVKRHVIGTLTSFSFVAGNGAV